MFETFTFNEKLVYKITQGVSNTETYDGAGVNGSKEIF